MKKEDILKEKVLSGDQKVLLSLLDRFDERCRKFGIKYYLGAGTGLGATRHEGFIPWDDDVDLYIPREEYNKMVAVQDEFFDEDFVLVSMENYPSYQNVLPRGIDTNSTAIIRSRMADTAPKGQFIEFFILDPIPDDEDERKLWLTKHWIHAELVAEAFSVINDRIYAWQDYDLLYHYYDRCRKEGKENVLRELREELFNIDAKDVKKWCTRWGTRNLMYDIEWFGEPRRVPFENITLSVASQEEKVLLFDYGDGWRYIPQGADIVTHNIAKDPEMSYDDALEGVEDLFNYDEMKDKFLDAKMAKLEWYRTSRIFQDRLLDLKEIAVQLETDKLDDARIEELLRRKDYGKVTDLFSAWIDNQFIENFGKIWRYVDIGDKKLAYVLTALLIERGYSKVLSAIEWRERTGEPLTAKLEELKKYALGIRSGYSAIFDKDIAALRRAVDACSEFALCEEDYDYKYLRIVCGTEFGRKAPSGNAKYDLDELTARYPDNGEVTALQGDAALARGDIKASIALYEDAYDKTNNGMVQLHIRKTLEKITEE